MGQAVSIALRMINVSIMAVVFSYHILWYLNIENTLYGGLKFSYALLV